MGASDQFLARLLIKLDAIHGVKTSTPLYERNGAVYLAEQEVYNTPHDNPELVKALLEHGANLNIFIEPHETPLSYACLYDLSGSVKVFLEHGANPNVLSDNGDAVLHLACENNHFRTVQILLEHHLNPNV